MNVRISVLSLSRLLQTCITREKITLVLKILNTPYLTEFLSNSLIVVDILFRIPLVVTVLTFFDLCTSNSSLAIKPEILLTKLFKWIHFSNIFLITPLWILPLDSFMRKSWDFDVDLSLVIKIRQDLGFFCWLLAHFLTKVGLSVTPTPTCTLSIVYCMNVVSTIMSDHIPFKYPTS